MVWVYWCKTYATKDEAYEIGAGWSRAATVDNPVTYGVKEVPPEWELMLKLKKDSSFIPDVEDEGFSPCTDFPRE